MPFIVGKQDRISFLPGIIVAKALQSVNVVDEQITLVRQLAVFQHVLAILMVDRPAASRQLQLNAYSHFSNAQVQPILFAIGIRSTLKISIQSMRTKPVRELVLKLCLRLKNRFLPAQIRQGPIYKCGQIRPPAHRAEGRKRSYSLLSGAAPSMDIGCTPRPPFFRVQFGGGGHLFPARKAPGLVNALQVRSEVPAYLPGFRSDLKPVLGCCI